MRSSVGIGPFRIYGDSYTDKQAKRAASWARTERMQAHIAQMKADRPAVLAAEGPYKRAARKVMVPLIVITAALWLVILLVSVL